MSFIEMIVRSMFFLLCPLAIYLLYTIYEKNISSEEKDLSFSIAILSSIYFILKFDSFVFLGYPIILFDIPLILSFYKKRTMLAIIVSIILIIYQNMVLGFNFWLLIIEYLIYLVFYLVFYRNLRNRKNLKPINIVTAFIIIKSFMLSFSVFLYIKPEEEFTTNLFYLFIIIIVLTIVTNLVVYFFTKGEKIVELRSDLNKIEREKELRRSLFKVTHEIKNPIAVCKGYLDMLDINDKKKVRKYIPIIKSEIARTLVLLDDFLDYTKIKITKEEMDLSLLIEELQLSLVDLFKKNHIKVRFNTLDNDIYIEADYNRLKQVLINILKNAVEAKDVNKKIMTIDVDTVVLDDVIKIIIKDNGIGMDNDTLMNMSKMFFTTKRKGSGLGVSLSKEIIEQHDGEILYESKLGVGTITTIILPNNYEEEVTSN